MSTQLRLLLVEDRPRDAELIIEEVRTAGFEPEWVRVQTKDAFLAQLETGPDIILADYNLPQFSGTEAIRIVLEKDLDVPLIIVSGTIGEDKAVEAIKLGAADYLLKDRLGRLGSAIERALEDRKIRISRREALDALRMSEERFRRLADNAPDVIYRWHISPPGLEYVSSAVYPLTGYTPEDFLLQPGLLLQIAHPDDREIVRDMLDGQRPHIPVTFRLIHRDGHTVWLERRSVPVNDDHGELIAAEGIIRDITARVMAEDAMRESEARFSTIFQLGPIATVVTRISDSHIMDVNKNFELLTGFTREEVIGRTALELNLFASPKARQQLVEESKEQGSYRDREIQIRTKSGDLRDIILSTDTVELGGEPCVISMSYDATERKQAEERLRYHANLLEQVSDAVISTDMNFNIRSWNRAAEQIYGWPAAESIGKRVDEVISTAYVNESEEQVLSQFIKDGIWEGEVVQKCRDGTEKFISSAVILIQNSAGQPSGAVAVNRDITERKQSEVRLVAERNRAQKYLDIAGVMLLALNAAGEITLINKTGCKILGYEESELLGKDWVETCLPTDIRIELQGKRQGLMAGDVEPLQYVENEVMTKSGTRRMIAWTNTVIVDESGTITGILSSGEDITERKVAEKAELEQRLLAEALRDSAAAVSSTLDLDEVLSLILEYVGHTLLHEAGTVMLVQDGVASVVAHRGYTERGLTHDASNISLVVADTPNLLHMMETGHSLWISNTDGYPGWEVNDATRWIGSSIGAPIRVGDEVLGFINLDSSTPGFFTELHAERLQAFANQAATAVKNAQLYHELEIYSGVLEQAVTERTAELEATTHRVETILNSVGDALLVLDLNGRIQQINPAFERHTGYIGVDAEGEDHHDLLGLEFGSKGDYQSDLESLKPGEIWQRQTRVRRKDGSTYDADFTIAPVRDDSGTIHLLVAVIRDITPLKEVERAKDEFVSNVSHELRTPITGIKLSYSMLSMNPEKRDVYMERMGREINRLNELIEDLLRLTRLEQGRVELALSSVDLNDVGSQLVQDRGPLAETRSLQLGFDPAPTRKTVKADRGLLEQALSVLLTNAMNYTPAGGQVLIRCEMKNSEVGLSVSDSGPGISPAEQPKLFERFYRGTVGRKSGAPGTGLGLNIAKQIVERHGGRLELFSEGVSGKGSVFTIWLPAET